MQLVVIINGMRSTGQSYGLAEAAQQVAKAHRAGQRWDVRRALDPLAVNHRPLNDGEAAQLVQATAKVLA